MELYSRKRLQTTLATAYALTVGVILLLRPVSGMGQVASVALSGLSVPTSLYFMIRKRLWSWPIIRQALGVQVPNLTGRWVGFLRSSTTSFEREHPIAVEIYQTMDSVHVVYFDCDNF